MNRSKRVGLYLRVSTRDQTTTNQLLELEKVAQQRGWHVSGIYEDVVSGTKGRDQRPSFDRMCKDCARGKLDMVATFAVDRLGRSLQHVVSFMSEMTELGVDLYIHQSAVDTSTPAGKAMLSMCGVFAEFERSMIVARIDAGLTRARAEGKRLGRPPVSADVERAIQQKRSEGLGINRIARELRIGNSVVQRVAMDCG